MASGIDEAAISIADMAERLTLFSGNFEGLGANTDRQVSMQNSVVDILMSIDESIFKLTSFLIATTKKETQQDKFRAQEDAEKEKESKGKKTKPNKKDKKKEKESLMSLLGISALWRTLMATISAFALAFTTPILMLKGALVRGLMIVSRFLTLPMLAIVGLIAFILGAIEGWNDTEGKDTTTRITAAIMRGLTRVGEILIGYPADIIKSIISWVAGAMGFTEVEAFLDSFSFQEGIAEMGANAEAWMIEIMQEIKGFFLGFLNGSKKLINKANRAVGGENVFDLSEMGFETEAADQKKQLSADTNERELFHTVKSQDDEGRVTTKTTGYTEAEMTTALAEGTIDTETGERYLKEFEKKRKGDADDIISEIESGVLDGQLSEKEAAYMMADVLREYPEADGMIDGTAFLRTESDLLKAAREVLKDKTPAADVNFDENSDIPVIADPPVLEDVVVTAQKRDNAVSGAAAAKAAVATQSQQQSFGQDLGDGSSVMGTTGFANSEDEAIAKVAGDEARADNVRAFKRRQEARKQKVAEMSLDQLMSKVDRSPQSPLGKLAAVELERRKQEAIAGGTYKTETAQVLESTDMDMVPPQTPKAVGASGKLATEQDVNNAAKQQATMNVATGGATTNNSTTINGGGGGGDNAAPMSPRDNAEPARQLR
jgi:hypothetical protein